MKSAEEIMEILQAFDLISCPDPVGDASQA